MEMEKRLNGAFCACTLLTSQVEVGARPRQGGWWGKRWPGLHETHGSGGGATVPSQRVVVGVHWESLALLAVVHLRLVVQAARQRIAASRQAREPEIGADDARGARGAQVAQAPAVVVGLLLVETQAVAGSEETVADGRVVQTTAATIA